MLGTQEMRNTRLMAICEKANPHHHLTRYLVLLHSFPSPRLSTFYLNQKASSFKMPGCQQVNHWENRQNALCCQFCCLSPSQSRAAGISHYRESPALFQESGLVYTRSSSVSNMCWEGVRCIQWHCPLELEQLKPKESLMSVYELGFFKSM